MDTCKELRNAIASKDAYAIEEALTNCFRHGMTPEHVPELIELLGKPWHHRHEDVVHALQCLKDPRAVEPLFREAHMRYDYRDYDEVEALARKCTWALADIGTPEAKAKLEELAQSENALVAEFAQRRLDRWEVELPRKSGAGAS